MFRKLLGAASGAALVLSIAAIGVSTASATSSVTCKSLTGTLSGNTTISRCTPVNAQYKSATAKTTTVINGGASTWSPSKKTTIIAKPTATKVSPNKCPVGSTEYKVTSKVTGGTATYTKKGDAVSGLICLSSTGNVSLLPGTTFKL